MAPDCTTAVSGYPAMSLLSSLRILIPNPESLFYAQPLVLPQLTHL